jgi:thiol-disulfide isomerase/thioredoxin
MNEKSQRRRGLQLLGIAAVAGAIAGLVAVYFIESGEGNSSAAVDPDCSPALAAAERTAPFAKGEVAAFRVSTAPDKLADIAFKAPDGTDTTLGAFAGRTVLFNLWATWCVPCRTEMPALDRLEATLGGKDFEVVAVNIDLRNEERARAFLGEIGVKELAFYSDPTTALFADLKKRGLAFGLPTTVLVDGKGCRIGVLEGPAVWDSDDAKALIGAALSAA